ncbi:helix-turn-helix domain-containing protein [Kordia jejudonensis]|uniref:helix-turn-helix domain-containing protein n=1 Tax=Kordia jejudonensis TaxID=1348245 RepID=UPI00062999E6|nr:helix-turn-helix domain-containing protein [Kordia jejudonensis]
MKSILILFLSCFVSIAVCQTDASAEKSYDELLSLYKKYQYKDTSKALTYIQEAKEVATIKNNQKQLTTAYYYIAKSNSRLGAYKKALTEVEIAISKSVLLRDTVTAYNSYFLKASIHSDLGDDSTALVWFLKSMEYAKMLQNPIYELPVLSRIAFIKKVHKDFQEAIALNKEILQKLETVPNDENTKIYKLSALMNIADAYLWLKNTEQAALYNNSALELCPDKQPAWMYYPILMNSAIIHYQNEVYDACESITNDVKTYAETNHKTSLYLTTLFYLGKSAYKQQSYQQSIQYLEKAIDSINVSEQVDVNEKELHEYLALGYNKLGNAEKSFLHFKKYAALEKKQSEEDLKINNQTHELVDIVPLQSEIDTLGKELTKETSNRNTFIIASLALLILFISSIVYYRIREKRTREKFKILLQKVNTLEQQKDEKKTVVKKQNVSDDQMKILLEKINEFEKQEYFLQQECSLGYMAEQLGTNTSYLSKTINRYKGKSFTTYITELRINTALVTIKNDTTIQSYTIQAIAEEFGFKRQETFSKAFKAYTGIYPSQYVKNLKKEP